MVFFIGKYAQLVNMPVFVHHIGDIISPFSGIFFLVRDFSTLRWISFTFLLLFLFFLENFDPSSGQKVPVLFTRSHENGP